MALNEANAVLSDPTKRLDYESVGAGGDTPESADFSPLPQWDTGFEFSGGQANNAERSSFFEQLFGRAARKDTVSISATRCRAMITMPDRGVLLRRRHSAT